MMHTLGPWEWEVADELTLALGTKGKVLFEGAILGVTSHQSCVDAGKQCAWPKKEDANLIAAAPDLLAACKAALEDGEYYKLSETIKIQLLAAIAKATGSDS